ncbi:MAG: hypothetical protein ACM359_10005 [Bacillota bacterium]
MCNRQTQVDAHEIHKALDDLLQTFLVVSPRNADHPAVKRARDVVSRASRTLQTSSQYEQQIHAVNEVRADIPESFVMGSD